jgi:uncharacterized protein involved in exopolysaccharide biosynthesis
LAVATLVLVAGLLKSRTYTSTASFLPQSGQPASAMSGLAAQFGVDVSGSSPGTSPAFYADLSHSRQIVATLVEATYTLTVGTSQKTGKLADFLGAKGADWTHRRDDAIERLSRSMEVAFDPRTSVVTVSVRTDFPDLSRQVVQNLIAALNRFNLEIRQSQASAERRFTEQRLEQVRTDLRKAEDDLQFFLQHNRILGSAELDAQRERLAREVGLQQQVYATLAQAYERAKLDEVRDTPVLTVVQPPETPLRPDPRQLAARSVLSFLIAVLLASLFSIMRDRFSRHASSSSDELEEFAALKKMAFQDLRHPLRALSLRRKKGYREGPASVTT